MEVATGAMSSLLLKLGGLLREEYKLKDSVKKGIGDLKAELESMQGALVEVSSVPLEHLDLRVKDWANEARELSYAMEDSLDSFVSVEGVGPTNTEIKSLLEKARSKFTKFNVCHELADIKYIESQVREIKVWYDTYTCKVDDIVAQHATTKVDPRISAVYKKASRLVGTNVGIDELLMVQLLSEVTSNNPKIFSIVGIGGLGKTTLAKAMYEKLSFYERKAFVQVGQNQDTKKVLRDILLELDIELYKAASTMDEMQLTNQLKEILAGQRYVIVIDGIWDTPIWEMIHHAFVDSDPRSIIITTTCIVYAGTNAGSIYHMKPLSDDNSRILFHRRTSGGEGVSQDNQHGELTNKFLMKCGGVPLAIVTIASLLAGKRTEDWSKVYDAINFELEDIGFGDEDKKVIQNTRNIISFSYYDLQPYLKACLLYLRMYSEDEFIEKKSLIWRWIYEGFVPDNQGIEAYKLGESYYNQLVNKNMIREIQSNGQDGCRVHDMVLDLIRDMSVELNFVTVQGTREKKITSSPKGRDNRVHRLALQGANVEHNPSVKLEHVRSFNAIACSKSGVLPLSIFKVLRVLVIEDCGFLEGHSLEHLRKLVQLRYLGLLKTDVKLPEGIGHDLKFLEILDVSGGLIRELPLSVGEIENLRCLWADSGTTMKGRIGKLACLEELQLYSVEECPNFFTELGNLANLRVLKIQFEGGEKIASSALVESLCKLQKIEHLVISRTEVNGSEDFHETKLHVSLEDWAPSSRLNLLHLKSIIIPRIPPCIDSLSVPLLSVLWLCVEVVEARDLQTLGRLPSLLDLFLQSQEDKRISYTFGSTEFQKLEQLSTNIDISFEEGALPRLEGLSYSASASAGGMDTLVPWIITCPSLPQVSCRIDCTNCSATEVGLLKANLMFAERTRDFEINYDMVNCDDNKGELSREEFGLIESLAWTRHGIGSNGEYDYTGHKQGIRRVADYLETLLRYGSTVGRYGEQELRAFFCELKSLLDEEPEVRDIIIDDHIDDSDDDGNNIIIDGGNEEGGNYVFIERKVDIYAATSSRGQEEGAASLP